MFSMETVEMISDFGSKLQSNVLWRVEYMFNLLKFFFHINRRHKLQWSTFFFSKNECLMWLVSPRVIQF